MHRYQFFTDSPDAAVFQEDVVQHRWTCLPLEVTWEAKGVFQNTVFLSD